MESLIQLQKEYMKLTKELDEVYEKFYNEQQRADELVDLYEKSVERNIILEELVNEMYDLLNDEVMGLLLDKVNLIYNQLSKVDKILGE